MEVERIAPDEERLVLSKPIMHISFAYDVSRGISSTCLHINHQFLFYCYLMNTLQNNALVHSLLENLSAFIQFQIAENMQVNVF